MSHKAAKSMAKLIGQSCGDLQSLSACEGKMGHLNATRALMDIKQGSHKGLGESRLFNLHCIAVLNTYAVGAYLPSPSCISMRLIAILLDFR